VSRWLTVLELFPQKYYPGEWDIYSHFNRVTQVSRCLTSLQLLQLGYTGVAENGRLRVTSLRHLCPCDRQVYTHFNRVTPASVWLIGLKSIQKLHSSVPVTNMSRVTSSFWQQIPSDMSNVTAIGWHTCLGDRSVVTSAGRQNFLMTDRSKSLHQGHTCVRITDRSTVPLTVWHQCLSDWQVYNHFIMMQLVSRCLTGSEALNRQVYSHFNTVMLVSRWFTALNSFQQDDMCPRDWQDYRHFHMVNPLSRWLTGLQCFQNFYTCLSVFDRSRDISTGWQKCHGAWQVYNHYNKVSQVSRWYTLHFKMLTAVSYRHFNKVIPVTMWVTVLDSHQPSDTCLPLTVSSNVTLAGWYQCAGDWQV
jgi:hypothetical protein